MQVYCTCNRMSSRNAEPGGLVLTRILLCILRLQEQCQLAHDYLTSKYTVAADGCALDAAAAGCGDLHSLVRRHPHCRAFMCHIVD